MNKRGINQIVTTVVIIFVIIIAIFLIWFFLRPSLQNTTQELSEGSDCLKIIVEPMSCGYLTEVGPFGRAVALTVKRNAGEGDLKQLKFIFENANGDIVVTDNENTFPNPDSVLGKSQQALYGFNISFEPAKVSVATVVGSEDKVCPPLAAPINCKVSTVKASCANCKNTDSELNILDYVCFQTTWSSGSADGDTNKDGNLNILDFQAFQKGFNAGNLCWPPGNE